jgi:outer membrane protein assembly factor BamB
MIPSVLFRIFSTMTDSKEQKTVLSASEIQETKLMYRLSLAMTFVAAIFCVSLAVLMAVTYFGQVAKNPSEDPLRMELQEKLAEDPRNESLKEQIREYDLAQRAEYFRRLRIIRQGGVLLLVGAIVLFLSARFAVTLNRKLPVPDEPSPEKDRQEQEIFARGGLLTAGLLLTLSIGMVLGMLLNDYSEMNNVLSQIAAKAPREPSGSGGGAPGEESSNGTGSTVEETKEVEPYAEAYTKYWTTFRGPHGSGISHFDDVPTTWDAATGRGVLWKTAVPLPGNNSPVVWDDQIFLSGATEEKRMVYSFDAETGELLWEVEAPGTPQSTMEPPPTMEDTGFAAPTMAVDGHRAYAIFANGDVVAVSHGGEVVWSRSLGIPESAYGYAASLTYFKDRVIIQYDQGDGSGDHVSRLLALDGPSGDEVWNTVRKEMPNTWPSPIVTYVNDQPQIITAGDPWVIAYNPENGEEIWRCDCLEGDIGPTPIEHENVVYVANEFPQLTAIDATGQGDVTETHILWTGDYSLPDSCSPLAVENQLFTLASYGFFTCYGIEEQDFLWEWEYDGEEAASYYSSPSFAAGHIYLFAIDGRSFILQPGEEGAELVEQGNLGEECVTSPAFQPGRIYIRGKEHLFCLGKKE